MTVKVFAGLGAAEPVVRAQWVKRFHLLPMGSQQSIAEHQWNVAMLFSLVWPIVSHSGVAGDTPPLVLGLVGMKWAMVHDLPEVVTGDMPTHIKEISPDIKNALDLAERQVMPEWWIEIRDEIDKPQYDLVKRAVKACDVADTLRSCRGILNPVVRDWVGHAMTQRFQDATRGFPEAALDILTDYFYNG